MNADILPPVKVDRNALTVASLNEEPDEKAYWRSRTPAERLQHIELLRRINYGTAATARLQRILEFASRRTD